MSRLLTLGAGGPVASAPTLWTPNDEAGLLGWWDQTTDRYNAGVWTKRWGTLPNWTIGTGAGPTEVATAFDGSKAALRFTGNSDTDLQILNPGFVEVMSVVVLNVIPLAGTNPTIWTRYNGLGSQGIQIYENYGLSTKHQNGNPAEDYIWNMTTDPQKILVTLHTSAARRMRVDGNAEIVNTTLNSVGGPASTDDVFMFPYPGSAQNWTADVAAIGFFTAASWSTGLAEKIEGYIAHNGIGITTARLPSGHTYKSAAPT